MNFIATNSWPIGNSLPVVKIPTKSNHFEEIVVYWDVKAVKPLSNFRIYVEIEDGRKGIFDLNPYLEHGAFRELRDVHYFNRVGIQFGAVTWPNEQDIAPETLLSEMQPVESTASHPAAR